MSDNQEKNKTGIRNKSRTRILNIFVMQYFSYIVILVCIIILLASFYYLILPKYKSITSKVVEPKEEQMKLRDNLKDYYFELNNYKSKFDNIEQENMDKIEQFLPTEFIPEEILSQMEMIQLILGEEK